MKTLGFEKYWAAEEFQRFVIVELIITECVFRVKKKLLDENRYILPANCYLDHSGKIKAAAEEKHKNKRFLWSAFSKSLEAAKKKVISVVKTIIAYSF